MVITRIKWRYRGVEIRIFRSLRALGNYIAENEGIEAFEVLNKLGSL